MPLRSDWSDDRCPIARSLDVVGDPWILLIIRQALSGARRFEQFRAELGIADTVLSRRLQALVDAGLLQRSAYRDGRTRAEYVLTEAGADLLPLINGLVLWGEKHRPHADPDVSMQIVHVDCGEITTTADTCSACGRVLEPAEVSWRKSWRAADVPLTGSVAPVRTAAPGTATAR